MARTCSTCGDAISADSIYATSMDGCHFHATCLDCLKTLPWQSIAYGSAAVYPNGTVELSGESVIFTHRQLNGLLFARQMYQAGKLSDWPEVAPCQ